MITTNSPLKELEQELTVRSMNILRANEITTVGQLINVTRNSLLRLPNLGKKSVLEIEEVLKNYGMALKPPFWQEQVNLQERANLLRAEAALIQEWMEDLRKKHLKKTNEFLQIQKMIGDTK